jgi:hypothetical protein
MVTILPIHHRKLLRLENCIRTGICNGQVCVDSLQRCRTVSGIRALPKTAIVVTYNSTNVDLLFLVGPYMYQLISNLHVVYIYNTARHLRQASKGWKFVFCPTMVLLQRIPHHIFSVSTTVTLRFDGAKPRTQDISELEQEYKENRILSYIHTKRSMIGLSQSPTSFEGFVDRRWMNFPS